MSKKVREDYYGPGWGRSKPIMIGRGLAGRKPFHEAAAYLMTTKYRSPLATLVGEFTYHGPKFTRNDRQWWGHTRELAWRLGVQLFREGGFKEIGSEERRLIKELEEALKLERLEDFRRFHRQMRTCAYILKDVGVRVSWEKVRGREHRGSRSVRESSFSNHLRCASMRRRTVLVVAAPRRLFSAVSIPTNCRRWAVISAKAWASSWGTGLGAGRTAWAKRAADLGVYAIGLG